MYWAAEKVANGLPNFALRRSAILAVIFLPLIGIWHDKLMGIANWALDKILTANMELYFDLVAMGVGICH